MMSQIRFYDITKSLVISKFHPELSCQKMIFLISQNQFCDIKNQFRDIKNHYGFVIYEFDQGSQSNLENLYNTKSI